MHNIKELKPKIQGRYQQGYINPESCKKLFESIDNQTIIYRSSWEKRFIQWCESCKKVKHWGSECISIQYFLPTDKKQHTYYPDFVVEMEDGEVLVIEIKPSNQVFKPTNKSVYAMNTWIKNCAKWTAIKEVCRNKNYKFCILTEKTINKL
jgi:hypothetical protein